MSANHKKFEKKHKKREEKQRKAKMGHKDLSLEFTPEQKSRGQLRVFIIVGLMISASAFIFWKMQ